jgi:hypothetical protein
VRRNGMAVDHESDVTELLANTVQEHLHVLFECSPCESQEPNATNLQNYVKVTEVSSFFTAATLRIAVFWCDTK